MEIEKNIFYKLGVDGIRIRPGNLASLLKSLNKRRRGGGEKKRERRRR